MMIGEVLVMIGRGAGDDWGGAGDDWGRCW